MFVPGPFTTSNGLAQLAFLDRKGAVEPLKLQAGTYLHPRVSPDGKRIVFGSDDGNDAVVWIYELCGATAMRRLTFGGKNRFPLWSADRQRVAFQSDREGDLGIFWRAADGSGPAERLTRADADTSHIPESWSPKEDAFLFRVTRSVGSLRARGGRITRMKPAATRSMCNRFPAEAANGRSPPTDASVHDGDI